MIDVRRLVDRYFRYFALDSHHELVEKLFIKKVISVYFKMGQNYCFIRFISYLMVGLLHTLLLGL